MESTEKIDGNIVYKHVTFKFFGEHIWYLLYSPWSNLSRLLRLSKSLLITLYHDETILNRFVFEKRI